MMFKYVVSLIIAILLHACGDTAKRLPEIELSGRTMGTQFTVKLVEPHGALDTGGLQRQVVEILARIEYRMSTYAGDSELSRFNLNPSTNWVSVSHELCSIVESALELSRMTDGAFDITVGPLVNLWGFGPDAKSSHPPSEDEISNVLQNVGFEKLHSDCLADEMRKDTPDVYIDLSAYAKGYAVDRIAELLNEFGLIDYLVEIGGELRSRGHNASGKDWAVAIEKPLEYAREVQSIVYLSNSAVATSGDYRSFFEFEGDRYSHAIDPRRGRPVSHNVAAVTVVDETAAIADAFATALLVLGLERGLEFAEREGIAAYFLLRRGAGVEEHMTSLFSDLHSR